MRHEPIPVPRTIVEEYARGDSPATIAARYEVSPATICNRLKQFGAKMRPCGRRLGDPSNTGGAESRGLPKPHRRY